MRRRLLGEKKKQAKGQMPPRGTTATANPAADGPSSPLSTAPSADLCLPLANRRSFTAADGPGSADYSGFLAENKYATIGGARSKWPLRSGGGFGGEKALNGRPLGARPRSMGAAQMGVKCSSSDHPMVEEEETAFGTGRRLFADLPPPPLPPHAGANLLMSATAGGKQHAPPGGPQMGHPLPAPTVMFQSSQQNNRNSTGSTNSSQTSSGFESAKSTSSQQLAQSSSSGSCASSTQASVPPLANSSSSPADPASPSSRLSSAGSSTQGGRSSAYFSLSDGLECSLGPGGTLIAGQKRSSATTKSQHGRGQSQQQCARVNIGEMMAKGIPEPEIFAEWLQRLCLSDYLALFLAQGYDLPTLARATPEDLTTLGITRPEDRKRLVQDIQCWRNVRDQWPSDMARDGPVRDWLAAIGLKQYTEQFEQQGYLSVGELEQLEADDLEDIGVRKLGHLKKIWLALKKLKQAQARRAEQHQPQPLQPILSPATLRPCNLPCTSSSGSSCMVNTMRRHSQPQQQQTPLALAPEPPRLREGQPATAVVQFRNSSFGVDELDKGPPRLNLYRTSQIIAQLPREPPPELADEEDGGARFFGGHGYGHIPPPPAPMPLSPVLPYPPVRGAPIAFGSLSQPATPRNVQKFFAPAQGQQQQFHGIPATSFQQSQQQQGRLQLDQILDSLSSQHLDNNSGGFYSARGGGTTMGRR